VTPAARRLLAAAAQHRRQRASFRWFTHHAQLSHHHTRDAVQELVQSGHLRPRHGNDLDSSLAGFDVVDNNTPAE
jgi:hypothetical protein